MTAPITAQRAEADPQPSPNGSPTSGPFHSPAPTVALLRDESTSHPFALAIAAAWSCYGARPAKVENVLKLIHEPAPAGLAPDKVLDRAGRRERALKLYADLFAAGH